MLLYIPQQTFYSTGMISLYSSMLTIDTPCSRDIMLNFDRISSATVLLFCRKKAYSSSICYISFLRAFLVIPVYSTQFTRRLLQSASFFVLHIGHSNICYLCDIAHTGVHSIYVYICIRCCWKKLPLGHAAAAGRHGDRHQWSQLDGKVMHHG